MVEMDTRRRFRELLHDSTKIVGFTGAGASTESGIADYRSQGGIWQKFTPVYLDEFINDEDKRVLYWQRKKAMWRSIRDARPGKAHTFFTGLHHQGRLHGLITQNIDGLHEKSGLPPEKIVNLHGTTREISCLDCGLVTDAAPIMEALDPSRPPRCDVCNGLLKPNTVSFGQQLAAGDLARAEKLARSCDLLIAVGSTLLVQPAATYPLLAKESGAHLVIITLSETPLDRFADLVVHERLAGFLPGTD